MNANIIEIEDMIIPVRNIKLYAIADGWEELVSAAVAVTPVSVDEPVVWKVCMKNPATIGPIDIPIIIITTLIPRDIPLNWIGVEIIIMLKTPVFNNAKPTAITARFPPTKISVEWNANIPKNPTSEIIVPNTTGLILGAYCQNVFVVTKYTGIDPEVYLNRDNDQTRVGIDNVIYPRARTFSISVNLNF